MPNNKIRRVIACCGNCENFDPLSFSQSEYICVGDYETGVRYGNCILKDEIVNTLSRECDCWSYVDRYPDFQIYGWHLWNKVIPLWREIINAEL